jgi:protein-disulfide isomerase
MENMEKTKILLFISKSSLYFQTTMMEFQKLMKALEEVQPFTSEIIDVTEKPEMAEQYKVDALPTMIIGDKRFIGQPDMEKIMHIVTNDDKSAKSAKSAKEE